MIDYFFFVWGTRFRVFKCSSVCSCVISINGAFLWICAVNFFQMHLLVYQNRHRCEQCLSQYGIRFRLHNFVLVSLKFVSSWQNNLDFNKHMGCLMEAEAKVHVRHTRNLCREEFRNLKETGGQGCHYHHLGSAYQCTKWRFNHTWHITSEMCIRFLSKLTKASLS